MSSLWLLDGALILDGGAAVLCEECPCVEDIETIEACGCPTETLSRCFEFAVAGSTCQGGLFNGTYTVYNVENACDRSGWDLTGFNLTGQLTGWASAVEAFPESGACPSGQNKIPRFSMACILRLGIYYLQINFNLLSPNCSGITNVVASYRSNINQQFSCDGSIVMPYFSFFAGPASCNQLNGNWPASITMTPVACNPACPPEWTEDWP